MKSYRDEILKTSAALSIDIYELTHMEEIELSSGLKDYIDNNIKSSFL